MPHNEFKHPPRLLGRPVSKGDSNPSTTARGDGFLSLNLLLPSAVFTNHVSVHI